MYGLARASSSRLSSLLVSPMARTILVRSPPILALAPRPGAATASPIISNFRRSYTSPTSPDKLDDGEQAIYSKLAVRFKGKRLEVQDVSGGCGSFYAILISSPAFNGLSTIKQHKLVNECLKDDIKTIHGLQLKTIPEE